MSTDECALWYDCYNWRRHRLYDNETDAAVAAIALEEDETGWPVGVQFADGRVLTVECWPAYQSARAQRDADDKARLEEVTVRPRPAMRKIRDPFDHGAIEIEATEPGWVGLPE